MPVPVLEPVAVPAIAFPIEQTRIKAELQKVWDARKRLGAMKRELATIEREIQSECTHPARSRGSVGFGGPGSDHAICDTCGDDLGPVPWERDDP